MTYPKTTPQMFPLVTMALIPSLAGYGTESISTSLKSAVTTMLVVGEKQTLPSVT